jgi:hypothetical protein
MLPVLFRNYNIILRLNAREMDVLCLPKEKYTASPMTHLSAGIISQNS